MAEENYDVMISSKEYNQLRNFKKQHAQLIEQNKKLTKRQGDIEKELNLLTQEFNRKKLENTYLLQMIQSIVCTEPVQVPSTLETGKSVSFQVLGESVFQPQKAQERKLNIQFSQLTKKYATVVERINEFNKQQQEKDDKITQLNQTILQKQKVIIKLQAINQQSVDNKSKELLQFQKNKNEKNEKKAKQMQTQITSLKKLLDKREIELKKYVAEIGEVQKDSNSVKVLLQKHKEQNKKLTGLLKDFSQRNKSLQKEIDTLKKKGSSSPPNLQTIIKIKGLIDEHVREVQKNLKSIQGLSQQQITNLVRSELKQLMEYISKSIENKK